MSDLRLLQDGADKLARRAVYCLLMGFGAFFAYFNSIHHWASPPVYNRIKGRWLDPFMPSLEPYLPAIALCIGALFLAVSAYSFYRYATLSKNGG